MGGQSVCSGCGSDDMSCGRLWLFTKVTRPPSAMETVAGVTRPSAPMVMVAVAGLPPGGGVVVGGVGVVGVELLPPPQAAVIAIITAATNPVELVVRICLYFVTCNCRFKRTSSSG